jgi:hypothetical protein
MELSHLPTDIYSLIFTYVKEDYGSVVAWFKTCRTFHAMVTPAIKKYWGEPRFSRRCPLYDPFWIEVTLRGQRMCAKRTYMRNVFLEPESPATWYEAIYLWLLGQYKDPDKMRFYCPPSQQWKQGVVYQLFRRRDGNETRLWAHLTQSLFWHIEYEEMGVASVKQVFNGYRKA